MKWEIQTVKIYACNDQEYDEKLNEFYGSDGWEPFASEYQQDNWYLVRLKRQCDPETEC